MEFLPETVGVDCFADQHGGRGELDHAVVFVELGEVLEAAVQEVGDAPAGVALGADDVVHADLGEKGPTPRIVSLSRRFSRVKAVLFHL
ncbi:hypothetical protein [Corynebacterium casei]|uniref:hypothetical protein n=1 Tax=Corynebacterium casei TaxID=160386 RepID=UPI003FCF5718